MEEKNKTYFVSPDKSKLLVSWIIYFILFFLGLKYFPLLENVLIGWFIFSGVILLISSIYIFRGKEKIKDMYDYYLIDGEKYPYFSLKLYKFKFRGEFIEIIILMIIGITTIIGFYLSLYLKNQISFEKLKFILIVFVFYISMYILHLYTFYKKFLKE